VPGEAIRQEEVIIQTAYPFNPAIEFAKNHDFDGFFKTAMESRKELMYPPCGHIAAVYFKSEELDTLEKYANEFYEKIMHFATEKLIISCRPLHLSKESRQISLYSYAPRRNHCGTAQRT
jgi:primosomal protein N' (replication factor Y)